MVELDSDQLNVGLEATAMASADGEAWTPNPGEYLQGVGDFDGDGVKDDFIVRRNSGKQQGMMEVWRTQEGVIQGDDILAWGNHTIVAPRVPIAVNDNNETQDTSIVFSNRGEAVVLTMAARATVLDMPEDALALLVQPVAALGELDPLDWADGVADFINDADDVSGASIYLRYQHVQSALFAGLDLGLQAAIIDAITEEYGTKGSAGSNSGTVVSTSQRIDNQGNVIVTGPRVMNRHYDYLYPGNEYRYGGPDNASGSASGAESGSNSGSSGSGSSGSGGGSGDTGSGGEPPVRSADHRSTGGSLLRVAGKVFYGVSRCVSGACGVSFPAQLPVASLHLLELAHSICKLTDASQGAEFHAHLLHGRAEECSQLRLRRRRLRCDQFR